MTSTPASSSPPFEEVVATALSRRGFLKVGFVAGAGIAAAPLLGTGVAGAAGPITFTPIVGNSLDQITLPSGFTHDVLIRWGDPVVPGAPAFSLGAQTPAKQAAQFGFNCDYTNFCPLPVGSSNPGRGLLWVNHEYTDGFMMFPGYNATAQTADQIDIEILAHGASIVEVVRGADGSWTYDPSSSFNRRITGFTPMVLTGPAAGNARLQTSADPTGRNVLGMLNNCGGGFTPWGTVLTAEENFNQYFSNNTTNPDAFAKAQHTAFGIPGARSERGWETRYPRFNTTTEPNEPFRFGWVVEVDPYDPTYVPKKRTALGRTKHEAAWTVVAANGKAVTYTGDDERFQFLYKFVTAGTVNTANRAANDGLLDTGTLYVARFEPGPTAGDNMGTGVWLPLVHGTGPLTVANGWADQADVLVRTRTAAAALGATPMDRPEDVEVSPMTGKVYMACTNNTNRTAAQVDEANPRANNRAGHVIEMIEAGGDQTATTFAWNILMLCGEPSDPGTFFGGFDKSQVSRIGAPDNLAFDTGGNLWIATDGMPSALRAGSPAVNGPNDGLFVIPVEGSDRGHLRQLLSSVIGCETASLFFNPDDTALFSAIQHPGEGGSIAAPTSQWPSAAADGVARPSVIVVRRNNASAIPSGTDGPPPIIPEVPTAALLPLAAGALLAGAVALRNRGRTTQTEA